MAVVTLRVIDGADRGRLFEELDTPVTIGREDGNSIQLNDDRISRFHVKIQEDHDKIVLTDLASTNGTQVNGEDTQLRILKFGDLISLGRSVLLYGSREQIAARLASLRGENVDLDDFTLGENLDAIKDAMSLDFELNWSQDDNLQSTLHVLQPPEVPDRLDPVQAAQLSELIEYLHVRMRFLLASVQVDEGKEHVSIDQRQWQNLVDLQSRLADYLRAIGDPDRTV